MPTCMTHGCRRKTHVFTAMHIFWLFGESSDEICKHAQVPFLFKYTVDALASPGSVDGQLLAAAGLASPVALLAAYGCARAGASLMSELRNAVFAKVAQGTIRKVGNQVSPLPLIMCRRSPLLPWDAHGARQQCGRRACIQCAVQWPQQRA
jgi:hypothetical protein